MSPVAFMASLRSLGSAELVTVQAQTPASAREAFLALGRVKPPTALQSKSRWVKPVWSRQKGALLSQSCWLEVVCSGDAQSPVAGRLEGPALPCSSMVP